jgi:hypothetical protein
MESRHPRRAFEQSGSIVERPSHGTPVPRATSVRCSQESSEVVRDGLEVGLRQLAQLEFVLLWCEPPNDHVCTDQRRHAQCAWRSLETSTNGLLWGSQPRTDLREKGARCGRQLLLHVEQPKSVWRSFAQCQDCDSQCAEAPRASDAMSRIYDLQLLGSGSLGRGQPCCKLVDSSGQSASDFRGQIAVAITASEASPPADQRGSRVQKVPFGSALRPTDESRDRVGWFGARNT